MITGSLYLKPTQQERGTRRTAYSDRQADRSRPRLHLTLATSCDSRSRYLSPSILPDQQVSAPRKRAPSPTPHRRVSRAAPSPRRPPAPAPPEASSPATTAPRPRRCVRPSAVLFACAATSEPTRAGRSARAPADWFRLTSSSPSPHPSSTRAPADPTSPSSASWSQSSAPPPHQPPRPFAGPEPTADS